MRAHKAAEAFHDLIRKIKTFPELKEIRFVRRYGSVPAENPVEGFVAACGIKEVKSAPAFLGADSCKDLYSVFLTGEICLYSAFGKSSADTEMTALLIAEKIMEADELSRVRSVEIKDRNFESDLQAEVCRIWVKMKVYVCGEDEE